MGAGTPPLFIAVIPNIVYNIVGANTASPRPSAFSERSEGNATKYPWGERINYEK